MSAAVGGDGGGEIERFVVGSSGVRLAGAIDMVALRLAKEGRNVKRNLEAMLTGNTVPVDVDLD